MSQPEVANIYVAAGAGLNVMLQPKGALMTCHSLKLLENNIIISPVSDGVPQFEVARLLYLCPNWL